MGRTGSAAQHVELDLGRYELLRGGRRVKLAKKPMELLILLVSRREQLVAREEIVTRLWRANPFIDTERNINNIVRKIRTALGDNSAKPRFLETVVGKGYRFIGPVHVIGGRDPDSGFLQGQSFDQRPVRSDEWRERASLAVLPLLLVGNATDDQGLCVGFADALASRLGNVQGLDVLPTSAVLNVPASGAAAEIASRLGVRFVLSGAIQMSKGTWRLSVEMSDTHFNAICFTRKCDIELNRLSDLVDQIAKQVAGALKRPLGSTGVQLRSRYSRDQLAYAEFMRGYRLSSLGDPTRLEESAQHLNNALSRDPAFSLAHAVLSLVYATRHFEVDPASLWLGKAEFHCLRALELDPDLPEGHVANAFLLWGPSKNFQHVEAIAELKRALALQANLPHAYSRLGTILAHIGLFDHAREMYERGRPFHPKKQASHSIVHVYVWNCEYDRARDEIAAWRAETPGNKYPTYFAAQVAVTSGAISGDWKEAEILLDEAVRTLPEDPLFTSLRGIFYAFTGNSPGALECLAKSCASPKSFGHTHHTYYQIACILSVLGREEAAFEWLERSVTTGFACWPFFLKDPCLQNLRQLQQFEMLVSSLQARYPDSLGVL